LIALVQPHSSKNLNNFFILFNFDCLGLFAFYYGGKTFEELKEWTLSGIPEQFREDFIKIAKEKYKHTW